MRPGCPISIAQTLRTKLPDLATLGATQDGAEWCLKALHPSDPAVDVKGIPDQSAIPSTFVNYQSVITIQPAAGATGTWSFDFSLLPDPICPASWARTDSVGTVNGTHLNPQLTGANYDAKAETFIETAERWRLAYMSVTAYQDGPDLANQGTLVAVQKPTMPNYVSLAATNTATGAISAGLRGRKNDVGDFPDYASAQAMPNAYFNQSKFGCYMPLKLTNTCQKWKNAIGDRNYLLGAAAAHVANSYFSIPTGANTSNTWPYYDLPAVFTSAAGTFGGTAVHEWGNDVCGQISAQNLSVQTSYTFYVRMGIEMQANPNSPLSPFLRLSPAYDSKALKMYYAIARELKDGYPADFNDLGKLWPLIKKAANVVGPMLGLIPHPVAQALSIGIPVAANAVDSAVHAVASLKKKKEDGRGNPSAADIQRARKKIAVVGTKRKTR